jgi:di/tricarboxylate transporter
MEHIIVFITLGIALGLFAWGRFRHDFVAFIALFILVIAGVIKPDAAFTGFSHPAVITVAAVLIIGKALEYSGLVDILGKWVMKLGTNITVQIMALSLLVAIASSFMNNVGALAVVMPIAIHLARKSGHSPSYLLMPVAFASLLGGLITMIGTPPNIIIATFRGQITGEPFGMFSFAPVGLLLTAGGLVFITFIGWRLLPKRTAKKSERDLFDIDDYITEVIITDESAANGRTLMEFIEMTNIDMQILGLVRDNQRIHAPEPDLELKTDDVIIIETDADELNTLIDDTGVKLLGGAKLRKDAVGSDHIAITEAVVMADSPLIGKSVSELRMRSRYKINLLAVARREEQIYRRLADIIFRVGDVVLLQGRDHMLNDTIASIGCLPLAHRDIKVTFQPKFTLALMVFIAAIVIVIAGVLPVEAAFTMAAVTMVLTGILPVKEMYKSIDWPVIVLLAAMIPVGISLETSGGADIIASSVLGLGTKLPAWGIIAIILTVTMLLSSVINNAATVLLMAPVAMGVANGLTYSIDPFLMAVAIGGSAAFLTPIGHQSNTLVMGPGGYKFTDYIRVGLPLSVIIVLISVPAILWLFPV